GVRSLRGGVAGKSDVVGYRCFDQRRSTTPSAGVRRLAELLSGAGGGALAGSALALLLGSKKARKVGGEALTYGSLAALGMLAYKAYNNWQAQQDGAQQREPQPLPGRRTQSGDPQGTGGRRQGRRPRGRPRKGADRR